MIGKADWTQYLHDIRQREIDLVFSYLGDKKLSAGLEVGAGDGFQTTFISKHIPHLTSSDLNFARIKESMKLPGVSYAEIDADKIEGKFPERSLDFIFSSNVLEHVRDPFKFATATQPMLTDNGYAVHIIPSRHIKIFYLALYYPNLALLFVDRLIGKIKGDKFFRGAKINLENNINVDIQPKKVSRLRRFLVPTPHGNFPGHAQEFIAFGRKKWEEIFIKAGYRIEHYIPGPAFSGYGFGFNRLRKIAEMIGVSSEHIFFLRKMSEFEQEAWKYTNAYLPRGSFYERKKFVGDWLKKEKNAKAFLHEFMKDVGDPRDKKVLDVGFGNGIMLTEFARVGALCFGLETESQLQSKAREWLGERDQKAELEIYDGKSFPFEDNLFDYAYSTSVLEHMSFPGLVIKEISRTLKPGGKFYLSFPNRYAPKESHTGLWFISWLPRPVTQFILRKTKSSPLEDWNLHFISYFDLKRMAKEAGLVVRYDTESSSKIHGFIKNILARFGVHHGTLLRTIIIVLQKP